MAYIRKAQILAKDVGLMLPRKAKQKKPVKRASAPESFLQERVEAYVLAKGFQYFHIPEYVLNAAFGWNPRRTGPELYAMTNASKDIKGFPDLMITCPMNYGRVLFLELKTEIGKMTPSQKDWQQRVGTVLCRSLEEAQAAIDEWAGKLER